MIMEKVEKMVNSIEVTATTFCTDHADVVIKIRGGGLRYVFRLLGADDLGNSRTIGTDYSDNKGRALDWSRNCNHHQ